MATASGKLPHLESVRGLAAVAVVVSHILSAFAAPTADGVPVVAGWDGPTAQAVSRLLMYPVGDGRFSVAVFFVLSGVVLSQRHLRGGRPPELAATCVRRFVRLAGPAAVATLIAWACWRGGLVDVGPTAELLAADGVSARWLHLLDPPDRSLTAAATEAGWGLYFEYPPRPGHELFNCPLWTIRVELYGSVLVYLFLALTGRHPKVGQLAGLAALTAAAAGGVYPALFLAGVWLAACRQADPVAGLTPGTGLGLVAAAFWVAGRVPPDYAGWPPLETLGGRIDPHELLAAVAAVLLIGAVMFCQPLAAALSARWLVRLGGVSFGLYLVHLPVLLTVGCGLFAALRPAIGHGPSVLVAGGAVLATALAGGWALTHLADRPSAAVGRWLAARLTTAHTGRVD